MFRRVQSSRLAPLLVICVGSAEGIRQLTMHTRTPCIIRAQREQAVAGSNWDDPQVYYVHRVHLEHLHIQYGNAP